MVATIVFTPEELKAYAVKAGLGLQFVTKEAFLFELIELLGEQEFVLKGGTAINKGYLRGHQRFSEDLDYDTQEEKETVKRIMRNLEWSIKKEFFTRSSIGFLLEYESEGVKDAVKVDFSFGIKGKPEVRKLVSDFIPVSKRATVYSFKDLNFQKERSFEERREWKDLYDLYWMSELYPSEFKIRDRKRFDVALAEIRVPKTANAFIPSQKRVNWEEVKEKMMEWR
jgi:predicted nucleotidyltransferase component of viral defense system